MDMELLTTEDIEIDIKFIKKVSVCKLGKFFYACNIPFKVVENEYILDLVKALCNIKFFYEPPCRQVLASSLLNQIHSTIVEERKLMFDGTSSVLMVHGWKNKSVNRKYLVTTIRNVNTPQHFLTFSDISLEREDGDTLSQILNRAIKFAKDKIKKVQK